MAEYRFPVDVGNRALQHCGAERMGSSGLSESSKRASEVNFVIGKLREDELRGNVWTFACRRTMLRAVDDDTMLLAPALWAEDTTYFVGSIVADQYGNNWMSRIPDNLANNPLSTATPYWEPYFGPMAAALYDSDTTYAAGEIVYTTAGDGTFRVYVSLQSGNADDPATATAWSSTVTYQKNDVVTSASVGYMSRIDFNLNQTPSASAADWDASTTYGLGDAATGSDGYRYTSVAGGNLGNDPVTTSPSQWTDTGILTPWQTAFVGGEGSLKWRQIGGAEFPMGVALVELNIIYPLGAGPSTQSDSRNIFVLPSGYLRIANQNPKPGTPWLGGPSGYTYNDWVFENDFLVSMETGPIPFRFVANVTDVAKMDPMFCEMWAAQIGMAVCEPLTQSTSKLGGIARIYDEKRTRAVVQNGIEQGPEDAPDDDYLTVRY